MEANNMMAMRDALLKVKRLFDGRIMFQQAIREAHEAVNAALAALPRNCDIGSAEEQQDRFREFCRKHFDARECGLGRSVAKCPAYRGDKIPDCSLWWAQMPYEEGAEDEGK